jgi:hypothetical protein
VSASISNQNGKGENQAKPVNMVEETRGYDND